MSDRRGMADAGRAVVGPRVLAAWDQFLAAAEQADLSAPTRLPGWRGHEVCVHLGLWDGHEALATIVASARAGGTGTPVDPDAANADVVARHRDASREQVLDALRANREGVARHLSEEEESLDRAWSVSTVGRLPLLTVLLGQAYELAVHQQDLVACGAPPPSPDVRHTALAALADVTGALAAQHRIDGGATLQTPDGGWRFAASPDEGWTVDEVPPGKVRGAGVEAPADLLLDASAGRHNPVALLARRRMKVHDLGGLLALVPIVESTPGIPGAPILRLAGRTLSTAGRLLRR